MRATLQLLLASLAAGATLPRGTKKDHGIAHDDFVHVDNLRLYDSKGLHYLTGNDHHRIQCRDFV